MNKLLKAILIITVIFTNACFAFAPISTQLSNIEKSLFGVEYLKETQDERLKRIEEEVLGEATQGDVQNRINKINEALGLAGTDDEIIKKQVDDIQAQGVSYPILNRLEEELFGKNYDGEGIYSRLDRLEEKVFNAKQEGDLNQRVERLSATVVNRTPEMAQNNFNDWEENQNDVALQLSGLENTLFRKTYGQDPIAVRLNRLERKIFQRDFASDDTGLRLQRLQAASSASKTAKYYDGNKFQKFTSTGLQIGTLVLMILAMIL